LGVDDRFDAGRGVRVVAVHPQSPAALRGLKQQDLLVAIDGQPVPSRAEFGRMMNQLPPGHEVKLEYLRGDIRHSVPVRLGTRPADLNAVPPTIAAPPAGAANVGAPPVQVQPNVQTLAPNGVPLVMGGPPMLGVRTTPVTQDMQRQMGLPHSPWKAADQPALDGAVPVDAATVLLLQDQIRSLEEEVALLRAKLQAANIDPDAP
jgi:S1-C subfamily serine protease